MKVKIDTIGGSYGSDSSVQVSFTSSSLVVRPKGLVSEITVDNITDYMDVSYETNQAIFDLFKKHGLSREEAKEFFLTGTDVSKIIKQDTAELDDLIQHFNTLMKAAALEIVHRYETALEKLKEEKINAAKEKLK